MYYSNSLVLQVMLLCLILQVVRRMPMDDVVILDVDESTIESPHVDDLLSLPPDVVSTLKHVLKKQSSAYGDTVTRSVSHAG